MSLTSEYWNIVVVQAETVEELKLALETKKAQGYVPVTAEQRAGVEAALGVQLPLRSIILHRKAPGKPAKTTADELVQQTRHYVPEDEWESYMSRLHRMMNFSHHSGEPVKVAEQKPGIGPGELNIIAGSPTGRLVSVDEPHRYKGSQGGRYVSDRTAFESVSEFYRRRHREMEDAWCDSPRLDDDGLCTCPCGHKLALTRTLTQHVGTPCPACRLMPTTGTKRPVLRQGYSGPEVPASGPPQACKLGSDGTVTERAREERLTAETQTLKNKPTPECECGCAKTREPHQKYCPLYGK